MKNIFDVAQSSGLFDPNDFKVRINPFDHYTVGNSKNDFFHVFENIMEGRSVAQKK